jgi:hypothetical protein
MATISNQTLKVDNVNATTVRATVSYRLTPSNIERLSRTVFSENIRLIGDDPGVAGDITIANFTADFFALDGVATFVDRSRARNILKSAMNEDPQFQTTGAEVVDETFARITLAYAGNQPTVPTLPPPTPTSPVTGAWK